MRLEHYDVEKLKRELLGLIGTYVDLSTHRVFFFGSRVADQQGDDRSDIDVGIKGSEPIPDRVMASVRAAVESVPTLYKIEVVDFATVDDAFRSVALQHIEVINEPTHRV